MSEKVEFTEVETGNGKEPENGILIPETENGASNETVHAYVVFEEGLSVEDGISLIEQQVLSGGELTVERKDTAGNAVEVILTEQQLGEIKELPGVTFTEIHKAAEPQESSVQEKDTPAETEEIKTEESDIKTKEPHSNTKKEEQDTSEVYGETEVQSEKPVEKNTMSGIWLGLAVIFLAVAAMLFWKKQRKG
jgi:hypothetical protein